jgi:hypothetical protein
VSRGSAGLADRGQSMPKLPANDRGVPKLRPAGLAATLQSDFIFRAVARASSFRCADAAGARTLKQPVEPSMLDKWVNWQTEGRGFGGVAVALA